MQRSDFEIVIAKVAHNPGLTARQISSELRKEGFDRFTSKLVNQILYRLLTAQLVSRDGSGEKPTWSSGDMWDALSPPRVSITKRPLKPSLGELRRYRIAETEIRLLLDSTLSPNDPYITPDWVGSHVIVTVNTRHPFWEIRLDTPEDQSVFCIIAAVDAFVQWKVAKHNEPPDATEVQKMRDHALRFCTLEDVELPTD